MSRKRDSRQHQEMETLEAERESMLQTVETLAQSRDVFALNKEKYIERINKKYDEDTKSKRKLAEGETQDNSGSVKRRSYYPSPEESFDVQDNEQTSSERSEDEGRARRHLPEEETTSCTSSDASRTRTVTGLDEDISGGLNGLDEEDEDNTDDDGDDDTVGSNDSSMDSSVANPTVIFDDESEVIVNERKSDCDLLRSRAVSVIQREIRKSKLTMAIQGFQSIGQSQATDSVLGDAAASCNRPSFDPETVKFNDKRFRKGRCYHYNEQSASSNVSVLVGIRKFVSSRTAECVLVVPFCDTILGQEEERVDYQADFELSSHCQVHQHVSILHLENFVKPAKDIQDLPVWVYEPQTVGDWSQFGYFLDNTLYKIKRNGKREEFRILELFSGAGGMHLGFHRAGFTTVDAVDNDAYSIATLKQNCGVPTYHGDVGEYLTAHKNPESRRLQGPVDCIVTTPPCKGLSGANRKGGKNDKKNNDLSLTVIEAAEIYEPTAIVLENVQGMWRRKHVHYLKNITKELLQLGYQVRVTKLRACDFGSAQLRPRLILFATHQSTPAPKIPTKTHGNGNGLLPIVTVHDSLSSLRAGLDSKRNPLRNTGRARTSLKAGQHGLVKLVGDSLAPTIRASSTPHLHPDYDRCISARESATLQDFPTTFEFQGPLRRQYEQVGNAVSVELATSIAQAVREILVYSYEK